jgi:hypothetical protein
MVVEKPLVRSPLNTFISKSKKLKDSRGTTYSSVSTEFNRWRTRCYRQICFTKYSGIINTPLCECGVASLGQ